MHRRIRHTDHLTGRMYMYQGDEFVGPDGEVYRGLAQLFSILRLRINQLREAEVDRFNTFGERRRHPVCRHIVCMWEEEVDASGMVE